MDVYEEIANKLQSRFSNAKVEFVGESILHIDALVYRILFDTQEPLDAYRIKEIKDLVSEFNFVFVDFGVKCTNGKIDMMFWIMPKPEIKPVKVGEV
ncbi:MAG: hypothetical protein JHC26_08980 [Thermofilum sp.]|jgi:hypothetical protein|uniref:hypothetical protein n=1 Tax=Thermofilum sp. TaxID=1961369 RepID=UPI00258E682B|nr:hypothetical protein [Thermofilum sp.]MCI4409212.1 hypothetical protein [Thermofilum sp.]